MATRRSPRRDNSAKSRILGKESVKDDLNQIIEKPKTKEKDNAEVVKVGVEEQDPQPGPSSNARRKGGKRAGDGGKAKGRQEDDGSDASYASAMLLDVLAQVASDRLETEPPRDVIAGQKLSKRVLSTLDILSLEHILQLNDKLLITLFSELTANEMSRYFSFQCLLMPDKCQATFSSYGNELRGKTLMLGHLKQHIKKLVKESEENESFLFAAEPLHARKKRLSAEKSLMKRVWSKSMRKTVIIPNRPAQESYFLSPVTRGVKKSKPTATVTAEEAELSSPTSKKQRKGKGRSKSGADEKDESATSDVDVEGSSTPMKTTGDDGASTSKQTIEENEQFIIDLLRRTQPYQDHNYTTVFGSRNFYPPPDDEEMEALEIETERPSARTAGLTSLNYQGGWEGKNKTNSSAPSLRSSNSTAVTELTQSDASNRHVVLKIGSPSEGAVTSISRTQQHVPIIRVAQPGAPADNMPIVSAEEVVSQEGEGEIEEDELVDAMNPTIDRRYRSARKNQYPPMPKSDLARQGRVQVLEEMLSSDDDDRAAHLPASVSRQVLMVGRKRKLPQLLRSDGTTDWERRMALKCIRELRLRKREDGSLNCKICENKSFTATATLMYHYRSHAGIKPFVCLICNTTFTRQHSLNYHMLIHNNQSRFTCKDCGRKFRHPSHFKEHMRRHTGETPFHCSDCPLRFKTRNTYKRHLRTRHNKLLTADGIRFMPYNPSGIRLRIKAPDVEEGSEEEQGSEEEAGSEEEEQYEDQEYAADQSLSTVKVEMESVPVTHMDTEGNVYQALEEEAGTSDGAAMTPVVLQAIPPENTASNKLLQFCSQVVSQEAG